MVSRTLASPQKYSEYCCFCFTRIVVKIESDHRQCLINNWSQLLFKLIYIYALFNHLHSFMKKLLFTLYSVDPIGCLLAIVVRLVSAASVGRHVVFVAKGKLK